MFSEAAVKIKLWVLFETELFQHGVATAVSRFGRFRSFPSVATSTDVTCHEVHLTPPIAMLRIVKYPAVLYGERSSASQ